MGSHKNKTSVSARRPTISLAVIARDEEANIAACLDSARGFVDEVVVVDTGSVDRTREIAREHGARVTEFAWCDDFSAARNAAIDAATMDWILMLDADETLDSASGPRLRTLIAQAPRSMHVYLPFIDSVINPNQVDGYISSRHSRLFRRSADLRFVGPIHEALRYMPAPLATQRADAPDIRIHHTGYIPAYYNARGKDERNMRLLTRWQETDPTDPLVHFHLGVQHAAVNRHVATAAALRECIRLCGQDRPWFIVDAYMRLVNALLQTQAVDELDELVPAADRANLLSPKVREVLADWYRRRGLTDEAERQLRAALDPTCVRSLTDHPGAGGWSARLALASLYEERGRPRDALTQIEIALTAPDLLHRGRAARSAARMSFALGDMAAARRWLAEARETTRVEYDEQSDLLRLRLTFASSASGISYLSDLSDLESALSRGDWQAAYNAAMRTPVGSPLAAASAVYLAEQLHGAGASDAALDVLQPVLDAQPDWPKVYWMLMQVLAAVGRYDDALAAADVLRALEGGSALATAA